MIIFKMIWWLIIVTVVLSVISLVMSVGSVFTSNPIIALFIGFTFFMGVFVFCTKDFEVETEKKDEIEKAYKNRREQRDAKVLKQYGDK